MRHLQEEKAPVHVLQIGMTANHGGVESFILNYAEALKNSAVFDYVDLYGKGIVQSDRILSEGGRIYTLQDYRRHPLAALKTIRQIVRHGNYACVHINMLSAASLVTVAGALLGGGKVLVHSHNAQTLGLHRKILHSINTVLLRRLPVRRLACSRMAGDWMFGKKPYEVIPNAIDTKMYRFDEKHRQLLRMQLGIGEETFVLGFVGRISPQKNPVYLVKILDALKKRGLDEIKLLIIGDGELRDEVRRYAEELGAAENIYFAGSRKNISEWYSAMDALLLPSLWEGLPLVGVEAQAAGLPCFLSDQITKEIALTDLVHFCSLTESAENWAEAILNSRKNPSDRYGCEEKTAQTCYSIHHSAQRLQNIYDSVSGE